MPAGVSSSRGTLLSSEQKKAGGAKLAPPARFSGLLVVQRNNRIDQVLEDVSLPLSDVSDVLLPLSQLGEDSLTLPGVAVDDLARLSVT